MRIQPLIQSTLFDVADWESDAEFAVFPQGARVKESVFAPDNVIDPEIVKGKRYLLKHSNSWYPDQFWGEVVAYRIGCLLGVQVPPAFAGYNSRTGLCGALIEWFYIEGKELFVWGGEFLQKIHSDFDRKYGSSHNLIHNSVLMKSLAQSKTLQSDWRRWWIEALLFDALIGNTDRHQDNWGLIFYPTAEGLKCKLTPLFDNGTSLGHERFPERVKNWEDSKIDKYINNGKHLLRWSLAKNQPDICGHFNLLDRALEEWPETRENARAMLNFSQDEMTNAISDLCLLDAPVPLSTDRMEFMLRLLKRRHTLLVTLLS